MKRVFLFLPFFILTGAALFAQVGADTQPVAIVRLSKSQPVSVKEFKEYVNWMSISQSTSPDPSARKTLSETERRNVLDTICNQLLACQAADQEKITVTDQEVNQALEEQLAPLKAYLGQRLAREPSDADVDRELTSQTGMTRASFKEQIRRSILTNRYLQHKKQAMFQSVKTPTESEIQKFYNDLKNKNLFDGGFVRPEAVRIKMIWVPLGSASAADKAKALDKANQLIRQIGKDPGKFDEAVDDSKRANSGYLGGDGPYLYKEDQIRAAMGVDFYDTVFRLKQGEVSKLLERQDGYYIVKVIETLRQKTLTLDDVYRLEDPRHITVRDFIVISELQQRQLATYEKASKELVEELKKRGTIQVQDRVFSSIVW
jgi:parvulin-like peptidyl-prolyl isomerase